MEINPGEAGIYDRYVVQEVIKEMAQHTRLDSGKGFKVLVLSEVDRLTKDAQAALRRTMEKYTKSCRLVLCCRSPSRVIEPVRSRCLGIRIAAPTQGEVSVGMSRALRELQVAVLVCRSCQCWNRWPPKRVCPCLSPWQLALPMQLNGTCAGPFCSWSAAK